MHDDDTEEMPKGFPHLSVHTAIGLDLDRICLVLHIRRHRDEPDDELRRRIKHWLGEDLHER